MKSAFTLFFDGSRWVGVYEVHYADGTVQAAQHIFGIEPTDAQLWQWMVNHGVELIARAHDAPRISPHARERSKRALNPKKLARIAAKEAATPRASTAAQEALADARDEQKCCAKTKRSRRRQEQAEQRYQKRTAKRKQKHRGR